MEHIEQLRQEYLSGLSYKAIAEKYHIDARTAKRYVEMNLPLSELEQRPFISVLDPYKDQIREWMRVERPYTKTIHEWLLSQGCECSYTLVNRFVQQVTLEYEKAGIYSTTTDESQKRTRTIPRSILDKASEEKAYVTNIRNL